MGHIWEKLSFCWVLLRGFLQSIRQMCGSIATRRILMDWRLRCIVSLRWPQLILINCLPWRLENFANNMKFVYQTTPGLATFFSKDSFPDTRRCRTLRGRSYWCNRRLLTQGMTHAQTNPQGPEVRNYQYRGSPNMDSERSAGIPLRRGGVINCYKEWTCHQGAASRFQHKNS